jgi:hypothetical protein
MIFSLWIMGSPKYGLDGLHEGGKDGMTLKQKKER